MRGLIICATVFASSMAFLTTSVAQTSLPPPLAQAITATQSAKANYAFTIEQQSGTQAWHARFDPVTAPRLQLVKTTRETLSRDMRGDYEQLEQNLQGVFWCADNDLSGAQDVRLLKEDATDATYAFRPPENMVRVIQGRSPPRQGKNTASAGPDMRGELTVTKPNGDVTGLHLYTVAPFSPIPIMTVQSMTLTLTCVSAPNGRRYAAEIVTDARLSVFGHAVTQNTIRRTSDLTPRP